MRVAPYLGTFAAVLFCANTPLLTGLAPAQEKLADAAELVETRHEVPKLKPAGTYKPKGNLVEIELSEYAGYAGLVAANGGLDPSEESYFFKKHNFKVKLTLSEEESWSALNSGAMAASATTVDVLAAYGRRFDVVVPAQIGFSRGADGVVVRREIKRINDLKGKVLATAQFTESDFFIRYLAEEAGLKINMLDDLSQQPDPDRVNLVFCADGFGAGDFFLREIKAGRNRLAGCVTWAPKTTEVAEKSEGKAYVLATNTNLLIVSDILVVNKGFASEHSDMVKGLTEGLLEGNRLVRDKPDEYLDVVGKAFKWDVEEARAQLAKVHLANFPENLAFFNGSIDSAGSFGYIYESAGYVYGEGLVGKLPDGDTFLDLSALKSIDRSGLFKGQKIAIAPIRNKLKGNAERDENSLLSKNIRFQFKPDSSKLDAKFEENKKGLDSIANLLQVSPGSRILLRGHADGANRAAHFKYGGEAAVRQLMITLKGLSKQRCIEVKRILEGDYKIDGSRISLVGVGSDEPTGKGSAADRRVEVQWFTVE